MISQHQIIELESILAEDYGLHLEPRIIADFGSTLVNYFSTLTDVHRQKENNHVPSSKGE